MLLVGEDHAGFKGFKMKKLNLLLCIFLLWGCGNLIEQPAIDSSVLELALIGAKTNSDWNPHFENINGVEMALVPTGCFMMGSEWGHPTPTSPIHKVCFKEPYWIDVCEVTQAQFATLGGEAGRERVVFREIIARGNVLHGMRPRRFANFAEHDCQQKQNGNMPLEAQMH